MADLPRLFRFRHEAMATQFEIIIPETDADETYAGQAAQALIDEVNRLEDQLSRFRPTSDIARLSMLTKGESASIGLAALDCLRLAKAMHEETDGAFDVTIGPLMKLHRDETGAPRIPHPDDVLRAEARVGMNLFTVDEETGSVTVHADHLVIDLGAVGKGYALDQCAALLAEWSIQNALLNAGDSTVLGLGAGPGSEGWPVTAGNRELREFLLRNNALSGSGFHVKGAHIINPRTRRPVPPKPERVWAIAPTAALSDAASTAFMVMTREEIDAFCARNPQVMAVLD
jgi:thiamine biosynthesis lipoprotein